MPKEETARETLTTVHIMADVGTYWEQQWDWYECDNWKNIKDDEWKHVRWFYENCNWRCGRPRGSFAVTSRNHGAPIGTARNPCDTLYKLLMEVRKRAPPKKDGKWEDIYLNIVNTSKTVMRKGNSQPKKKPVIVNWPIMK